MKNKLSLVLGGLLLIGQTAAMAQSLTVSASIPAASGLSLTIVPVTNTGAGGSPVFGTALTTNTIPFGNLKFDTTVPAGSTQPINIWDSSTYYAVNIGTTGGAGTPVVNVSYTEGTGTACPNIAANLSSTLGCLGTKTTATFDVVNPSVTPNTDTAVVGPVPLISLASGTSGELSANQIPAGDFERVYVGVWTGPTPAAGKPFTNADAPGTYSGTLTFTAVSL
jgi:hypothetical protein